MPARIRNRPSPSGTAPPVFGVPTEAPLTPLFAPPVVPVATTVADDDVADDAVEETGVVVPVDVCIVVEAADVVPVDVCIVVVDSDDVVPVDVCIVVDGDDVVPVDVCIVVDGDDVVPVDVCIVVEAVVVELVAVDVGVVVVVVVVVVGQFGRITVLLSRVTCPLRASTLPAMVEPVCTVASVSAKMFPTNVVLVPRVAELPTCQKTLQGSTPLISITVLFDAVIRVDATWKMNTASDAFSPSNVTVPVRNRLDGALYTPGASVRPPRSDFESTVAGVRPAASPYAVVTSASACAATASPACWDPLNTSPGGKLVMAEPGLTPRSPEMSDGPVFVTVVPAKTAKDSAVPNPTVDCAAAADDIAPNAHGASSPAMLRAPPATINPVQRRTESARVIRDDFIRDLGAWRG